jgi:predicted nucleic acid-binding protein
MILLDTNIFVIDRFFPRDVRYSVNKQLVDKLLEIDAGFSIFSLFELCGISSFNLAPEELKQWSYYFDELYHVDIVEPIGLGVASASGWFGQFSREMLDLLGRRLTWGDAVVLKTAEEHLAEAIVTWNKKHFNGRTDLPLFTPEEYLAALDQVE